MIISSLKEMMIANEQVESKLDGQYLFLFSNMSCNLIRERNRETNSMGMRLQSVNYAISRSVILDGQWNVIYKRGDS